MSNYILDLVREDDLSDPWGTATTWAFSVAENLAAIGEHVYPGLQYKPSPMGGPLIDPDCYSDMAVKNYINVNDADKQQDADTTARIWEVQYAAKILSRYLDWCMLAGKNY